MAGTSPAMTMLMGSGPATIGLRSYAPPPHMEMAGTSPAITIGVDRYLATPALLGQLTFVAALVMPSLIGSDVSAAIFWASAASSLVCAAAVSNCLRACA